MGIDRSSSIEDNDQRIRTRAFLRILAVLQHYRVISLLKKWKPKPVNRFSDVYL